MHNMVLLKFNFLKLNTSKVTLFTQLNKRVFLSEQYLLVAQGAKSSHGVAFCSMDETLDVRLPPWFPINNSALKSNSLKKI